MHTHRGQPLEDAAGHAAAPSSAMPGGFDNSPQEPRRPAIRCWVCYHGATGAHICAHRAAALRDNEVGRPRSEAEREEAENVVSAVGDLAALYNIDGVAHQVHAETDAQAPAPRAVQPVTQRAAPAAAVPVAQPAAAVPVAQPAAVPVAPAAAVPVAPPVALPVAQPAAQPIAQPAATTAQAHHNLEPTRANADMVLAAQGIVAHYDPDDPAHLGRWYVVTRGRTVGVFRDQSPASTSTVAFGGQNWTWKRPYAAALLEFCTSAVRGGVTNQPV